MEFARTPLAFGVAALFAAVAQAQQHTPPAQQLPPVVVTGTPLGSDTFQLVSPASVLEGQGLRLGTQPTLGGTVANEVGVSQTYFGPNSSRPIIRGLDGDRIRVLENGTGVVDASTVSFDHAVSLEPLLLERIEIVRGPAALLYGGNAVGGVVNAISSRIAQEGVSKPFNGAVDGRFFGAADEAAGAARVDVGTRNFVLHLEGFKRDTDDLRIPGKAWTSAAQAERGEVGPSGRLPNSAARSDGGAIGASLIFGEKGYTGASYSAYDSDYGTVAEENVKIKLRQQRFDFAGELKALAPGVRSLKYKLGYSDYRHREIEDGVVGTTFENKGYDSRIDLVHGPLGPLEGAVGAQLGRQEFSALGDESFLPRTDTENLAGFVYEEWRTGPWRLSFGGRLEGVKVAAKAFVDEASGTRIAPAASRRFSPWSGAVGAFYALAPEYGVAFNAAYTERAPVSVELFANGPHLATDAFELGNPRLGKEKSTAFDLGLRKQGDAWSGGVGVFYNRFSDFVALLPTLDPATGEVLYRDAEDRTQPAVTLADALTAGYAEPLRQFQYTAVPAEFKGFEADLRFQLARWAGNRLDLELRGDYTRAKRRDTGESLPRIPPLRYGGALVYARERLSARVDVLRAAEQDKVPEGETTTDAYTLVGASVSYRRRLQGVELEAFVRADNLLDEDVRLATSFLRDIAPLGRRAVTLGLRAAF